MKTEPILLPVKKGSVSANDVARLRKAGVLVFFHDNPSDIRLLRPSCEVDGGALLKCAMKALTDKHCAAASSQRELFAELVSQMLEQSDG